MGIVVKTRHLSVLPFILLMVALLSCCQGLAQDSLGVRFFQPAKEFNPKRFWTSAATGAVAYTGVVIGLSEVWYADYPRTSFQFFDDRGEWNDMDKYGHSFTAYFETSWCFSGAQWTGLERRKSLWLAAGLGSLFQATVETLDGFSAEWGFSVADIGFNTIGVGLFVGQELLWREQRILLKVSSGSVDYPETIVQAENSDATYLLSQRADDLYGGSYAASFLKDYNAMTIWASVNLHSFHRQGSQSKIPKWLNLAVGLGAGNLYGGFANEWEVEDDRFILSSEMYPRYRQFYLSPDIDLSRIPVKRPFFKMLLGVLNIFKLPAPALEVNTLGNVHWHWFHL
ncbi:MAG: DUF2279 domain-containing protein [Bacteroidota bacterium]